MMDQGSLSRAGEGMSSVTSPSPTRNQVLSHVFLVATILGGVNQCFLPAADDQEIRESPGPSSRFVACRVGILEGFELVPGGLEIQQLPRGRGYRRTRCSLGIVRFLLPQNSIPAWHGETSRMSFLILFPHSSGGHPLQGI